MKYEIHVENTHSNLDVHPFTGNQHDSERKARTELAMLFDSHTLGLLAQAGLVFSIQEVK